VLRGTFGMRRSSSIVAGFAGVKPHLSVQQVIIRCRNLPVAKLVPFLAEDADDEELILVAAGKMRFPKARLDLRKLWEIPTGP
jgi:hypothetical protein